METRTFSSFVLICSCILIKIVNSSCNGYYFLEQGLCHIQEFTSSNHVEKLNASNSIACGRLCLKYFTCNAFSFSNTTMECWLYEVLDINPSNNSHIRTTCYKIGTRKYYLMQLCLLRWFFLNYFLLNCLPLIIC